MLAYLILLDEKDAIAQHRELTPRPSEHDIVEFRSAHLAAEFRIRAVQSADSLLAKILIAALANRRVEPSGQECSELHGFAASEDFNFILFGTTRSETVQSC